MLAKYLLGEISPAERQAVEKWLLTETNNQAYYQQLQKVWKASKNLSTSPEIDENIAWEKFEARIAQSPKKVGKLKRIHFSRLTVAASVLAITLCTLFTIWYINQEKAVPLVTQSTSETVIDSLEDGSVVTLNKNSQIVYPSTFAKDKRKLTLQGEAFFNIAPRKNQPFEIQVNDILVTVVGTSFNISTIDKVTTIVVATGKVRIASQGQVTILVAGEKLLVNAKNKTFSKLANTDELYHYYVSKTFECNNTPLKMLVETLNKAYNCKIIIAREELNNLRIQATFEEESLDKVLEIIQLTFNIQVTRKNGQIILH